MSQNQREILEEHYRNLNPLNSFFQGKVEAKEKKIWEKVKEMEDEFISSKDQEKMINELKEYKATMIVNFGPSGKHTPGLVTENQSASQMLMSVLENFIPPRY